MYNECKNLLKALEGHLEDLEESARRFCNMTSVDKKGKPSTAAFSIWIWLQDESAISRCLDDQEFKKNFFGILGRAYTVLLIKYLPYTDDPAEEDINEWVERTIAHIAQYFENLAWY